MEVDEPLPPAAAGPSSEAFKNRMDAVFGALGGSSGLSQGWNVSQISVFKPGPTFAQTWSSCIVLLPLEVPSMGQAGKYSSIAPFLPGNAMP